MVSIGPRPSSAPGGGGMLADRARATSIGSFQQPVWVTHVEVGLGRNTATNANAGPALWKMGASPGDLIWYGGPKLITTYMDTDNPGGTGQLYRWDVTDLLIPAGLQIAGGVYNEGPASVGYWQDDSGTRMYFRNGVASVPDPFNHDTNSPEGRISISVHGVANRRPNTPGALFPSEGSTVTSTSPSLLIVASDPDADYGDAIQDLKVEVWNETNTEIIQNSGWVDVSSNPGPLFGHTLDPLTPGQYVRCRIYARDRAGAVSQAGLKSFMVGTAGAFEDIQVGGIAGTDASGIDVVTDTTPDLVADWAHDDTLDADSAEVQIVKVSDGSVYRGPHTITGPIAVGDDTLTFDFTDPSPDWAAMATGSTVYAYEVRGTDENAIVGPWNRSRPFLVNATPTVQSKTPANGTTFASPPSFTAVISDATDDDSTMRNMRFEVEHIDSSTTTSFAAIYDLDTEQWVLSKSIVTLISVITFFNTHGYDDYRWRVIGEDPWGAQISDSWRTFTYTEPPEVTITNPTDESTITNGTPTISVTSDRTIAEYRITLTRQVPNTEVWNSGNVSNATSSFNEPVPGGVLRNHATYWVDVWVLAADGLENTARIEFTLDYEAPDPVTGLTGTAVISSIFDTGHHGIPAQTPNVNLEWDEVTLAMADEDEYAGQFVIRISPDGRNRQWDISERGTTVFQDATPAGNVEHQYHVGYYKRVNDGVDTIMSTLAMVRVTPIVRFTTLTSENPDDPAVTFHFWRDRQVNPQHDKDVMKVMGLRAPIGFQGEFQHDVFSGEFRALTDPSNGAFTARDIVDTARQLSNLRELDTVDHILNVLYGALNSDVYIGRTARMLCYRDPKGRAAPVMIMLGPDEVDDFLDDRATFRMQFVEVAVPEPVVDFIDDADVVDVTPGA